MRNTAMLVLPTRFRGPRKKCSRRALSFCSIYLHIFDYADVALNGMEEVIGSIPIRSTKLPYTTFVALLVTASQSRQGIV